jgi:excinuclease ABC subunit A
MHKDAIVIKGAREHNLRDVDLTLPRDRLVVITGVSGSGKSSLAFDTVYAEGQRRYVESLSAYARQFLELMEKPDVDSIEGLSPAISIEQKTVSKNPRSTVGTVTEIHDYLRLLYARIGEPHCWICGRPIAAQTVQGMVDRIMSLPQGEKLLLLAPVVRARKGEYGRLFAELLRKGFTRVLVDGLMHRLDEEIKLDKKYKHDIAVVVDRVAVRPGLEGRLAQSVDAALALAEGLLTVRRESGEEILLSEKMGCPVDGVSIPELSPRLFSFNSPFGACPGCDGLGSIMRLDEGLVVPDPSLTLRDGAVVPWAQRMASVHHQQTLTALAGHFGFSLTKPFGSLSEKARKVILHGSGEEKVVFSYRSEEGNFTLNRPFEGVIPNLERRYRETQSAAMKEEIQRYMSVRDCDRCGGRRLKPETLAVTVQGRDIAQVSAMSVRDARAAFRDLSLSPREAEIAVRILKEINERLTFLEDVGLDYLTLDRASATLAGGEGQRIRLATQVGSRLVGVLYVLDEPSIGLHQRDTHRLLETLKSLRDLGNTVLVVEHDEATIREADWVVDLGPGAGRQGGLVVAAGTPEEIARHPDSLTGKYLRGEMAIAVPPARRRGSGNFLTLTGAREHNLREVTVQIPLETFTAVTGVSGSGKSTLVMDILFPALARHFFGAAVRPGRYASLDGLEHLDKVVDIDQSPIGRTPRSNPATYTGLFTPIRELFAQVPEARARGYTPGRFSFNVKGGRCEACQGDGIIKIEMHFLPDVYVTCDVCKGRRYNRETLEIEYRGQNIHQVLEMTVAEAREFFARVPAIRHKLETLTDVGLGYIHLGQPATQLSGGEAQRVKLSRELSRRATGRTLYILDEPTTGLHFDDIRQLMGVLQKLVDGGNTVLVIEHNLDVVKCADWIVDLGPEGGDAGGTVVAEGTPEQVAANPASHTGRYLKDVLQT